MDRRDRIFRQGLLQEKRGKVEQLNIKADRCRKDINIYLFSEEGIKGMQFEKARQAFEDLVETIDKYQILVEEIRRIEEEL